MLHPRIDLTGRQYGRLTVVSFSHRSSNHTSIWNCCCDCGKLKTVWSTSLYSGASTSCGCSRIKHGHSGNPLYTVWITMNRRCHNPEASDFARYGGRGIKVCERWRGSFEAFFEDVKEGYRSGLSLDRIKGREGYSPENHRWATSRQQARNRCNNRRINTPEGIMLVCEAAERFGINKETLYSRVRQGWPESRLLERVA